MAAWCDSARLHAPQPAPWARATVARQLRRLVDVCEGMDLEQQNQRPTEDEYQAALADARAALAGVS